jgi:hypothetical protein
MPAFQEDHMPEPSIVTGGGVADAYAQTAAGLALTASPLWIDFLYTVNIIAAAIAAVCGAIIGVAGVWRIIRRRGQS